jgi:trehalose 6-phosphate phosphatase
VAIDEAVQELAEVRALNSPHAVTLVPHGGPDKGIALEQARRQFGCDRAIYVGDDDTDEDAFRSAGPERLLSIRVGAARHSRARYCLKSQADIDVLMSAAHAAGA